MFFLNMVDYPVFFPSLSTLTWDTFLTLRGTWGFYLNHVLPPRPSKYFGVGWWWLAHKILVTAQVLGFWDLDRTLDSGLSKNKSVQRSLHDELYICSTYLSFHSSNKHTLPHFAKVQSDSLFHLTMQTIAKRLMKDTQRFLPFKICIMCAT